MSGNANTAKIGIGLGAVVLLFVAAIGIERLLIKPGSDPVAPTAVPIVSDVDEPPAVEPAPEVPAGTDQAADETQEPSADPSPSEDVAVAPLALPADDAAVESAVVSAPRIDTFFRNPDDTSIIAGRADPGVVIAVLLAGEEVGRANTAADGTFGTVLFLSASDQPRRLRLIADPDGAAVASTGSIIVPPAVAAAREDDQTVAEAEPAATLDTPADTQVVAADTASLPEPDQDTGPEEDADAAEVAAVPETDPVPAPEPAATTEITSVASPANATQSPAAVTADDNAVRELTAPPTLIADEEGVRVIAGTGSNPTQPELLDNIALDTITYDTSGDVILGGRATDDNFVQIYIDNRPISAADVTENGQWRIDLPELETGVYTLRVDEVDAEGVVQSRIETPFKREDRDDVVAILADETSTDGFDVAVRTVQPGATLWAIAEEQFGDGIMYVAVFEANKDQIRDPDLIFPGQVFRLPLMVED